MKACLPSLHTFKDHKTSNGFSRQSRVLSVRREENKQCCFFKLRDEEYYQYICGVFVCVCVLQMQQEVYNCVKIIRMSHVIHLQYRHVDATTASKGNRGDIFHPGQRAKHHRVGTVSLSLFFFFSFFSLFFPILELDLIFIPLFGSVHSSLNSFKTKVPPPKKDHWLSD